MSRYQLVVVVMLLVAAFTCGITQAVTIETVPVGNPGNVGDSRYATQGYGAVGYNYEIGKYEVMALQYAEFLNAVAATDTYGLYNTNMWSSSYGCKIQRSGSSGSYTYSVASDYANRPVNFVSWGDVARFANWLHNGQPTGAQGPATTEAGAYTLNGALTDAALMAVNRNADWKWAIPTEDEWYKAAYHKNDNVTGDYWDYPTSSNIAPSNVLGNPADPGNSATYYNNDYTIGSPYWRTEVGAHENSGSPYGTFDQGGNVWEWNEAVRYASARGFRGGSFYILYSDYLHAAFLAGDRPTYEGISIGFRVAYIPEPATLGLMALASVGILRRRTR